MLFAIIFIICFLVIGAFVLYLSRNIEHGEARFDASGKVISEQAPARSDQPDKTGEQQ
ncbi:MAG: hypothetical protein ACXIT4_05355 [Erythrobacter sp.]